MNKAVIFGAGGNGVKVFERVKDLVTVVYFTDNDEKDGVRRFMEFQLNLPQNSINAILMLYIASTTGLNVIYEQLINEFLVPTDRIIRNEVELPFLARLQFLESSAQYIYARYICGCVCEAGVFQGEFAKRINEAFPDRALFLFDTFEGFDNKDVAIEREMQYSAMDAGHLSITSVDLVLEKMPSRDKCIIKKGLFPDTFDLWCEKFCFVNLDMDLYQPTKAGLEVFFPRLERGGVILVHDYFHEHYSGVKAAVDEFTDQKKLTMLPIGDGSSIAIQKKF